MTPNGDGTRERLIADLERWLVAMAETQESLARDRQKVLPILTALRMGALSVAVAQAMLADKRITIQDTA